MTLIVCLDQRNGMRFNHRPQSTDRCVTERITQLMENDSGVCVFESGDILAQLKIAEKVIVFRWDKIYPSDTDFPMEECLRLYSLNSLERFSGYSHALITQEVYVR